MPASLDRDTKSKPWTRPRGKLWTFALSLLLSAGLLALVVSQVDPAGLGDLWAQFVPGYALAALACYLGNLAARGLRLRRLALAAGDTAGRFAWIRLCALHQTLFTVLPSGSADIGFPLLASRTLGCSPLVAARILLVYRLQDLWMLLILLVVGLSGLGDVAGQATLALAGGVALALLVWANDLTRVLGTLLLRAVEPRGAAWDWIARPLQRLATELDRPTDWSLRLQGAATTLVSWSLAALSIWALFAMIGLRLDASDVLLVIAGMNLVGAISVFTVAGLGVGEGGLAAILLALGFGGGTAVAAALTVRPAALASVLAGGALIELAYRAVRRGQAWTKRSGGTAAPRA